MSTRHRVAYIILKDNVVIHRCFNQTLATRDCKGWVGRFKLHSTEPPSHTGFCLNHCTVIAKSYNAKQRKIQQRVPQPTSPRLTPVPGPFCSAPSSAYTAQSVFHDQTLKRHLKSSSRSNSSNSASTNAIVASIFGMTCIATHSQQLTHCARAAHTTYSRAFTRREVILIASSSFMKDVCNPQAAE